MITEKELEAVKLSPTKKDFYQIWNELIDTASKISERWDPSSTNEADPGIVLLKVLTACADKLNYTVDKNILEAFMPSATQEESMRKLCEMLGYNVKYYRSATTDITISYIGKQELSANNYITIPKNTYVTNNEKDVVYCTLKQIEFNDNLQTTRTVQAIEGQLVRCEGNNGYVITAAMLDDNHRFYLPEISVAENGIFIYSAVSSNNSNYNLSECWDPVYNLNTQSINSKCYKFGYDSRQRRAYVQFPEDILNIIGNGLYIDYIRTNGANGNIKAKAITSFQNVNDIKYSGEDTVVSESDDGTTYEVVNTANFVVTNASATYNGKDIESIDDAYNGFKKTIGTFDTLVTCRDYMNAIYNMTVGDLDRSANTDPVVSNIIVSDIRDDINKAVTLCTFNEYGIKYINKPYTRTVSRKATTVSGDEVEIIDTINSIDHFDLVLYPFKTVLGLNTKSEYVNSFFYSTEYLEQIRQVLNKEDDDDYYKTISHNFITPEDNDIACIKNYVKLKAKITTTYKVGANEEKAILENIYKAIYNTFNMRKMDFGEEIPFDTILQTIQNADTRIKNVALEEPVLLTKFRLVDGQSEIELVSGLVKESQNSVLPDGAKLYNKITLQNVLAGKLPMFNYNTSFISSYDEKAYENNIKSIYPSSNKKIIAIESAYTPDLSKCETTDHLTLEENEVIQFRAPNYKTTITYPAYVNYYLILNDISKKILKNTEYKLQAGEYLLLNYTEAATDDSSTETIHNIDYRAGDVIKPNFDMVDSATKTNTFTKKTGFDFSYLASVARVSQVAGMYSFSASEQVEIREKVEVNLGKTEDSNTEFKTFSFYWIRNDEDSLKTSESIKTIKFTWDEDKDVTTGKYMAHTLQEGEYLFYTDKNKTDIAYYGTGSKIIRTKPERELYKDVSTESLTAEAIQENGLAASIPWQTCTLNNNDYITIKEYQYISLLSGDKLVHTAASSIGNAWTPITNDSDNRTVYKLSGEGTEEEYLPILNNEDEWEVRSKLLLNVGPSRAQTLNNGDKITITYEDNTKDSLMPTTNKPLSIKTNYSIYQNYELVDIKNMIRLLKENNDYAELVQEFMIKTFEKEQLLRNAGSSADREIQSLDNFSDYWTKIPLTKAKSNNVLTLHAIIPENTFGLMTIYYVSSEATINDYAYLTKNTTGSLITNYTIYNNQNSWWPGYVEKSTKYHLRPGLNVVKIAESCDINICVPGTSGAYKCQEDSILIADLDLIYADEEINPRLKYNFGINQLNEDINNIDTEHLFYYNANIENANALDINPYININREDADVMDNPRMLYDYNNVCNKFVISEIDAAEMISGITLTRSSKI